ncbi:MAG: ATP-binding protein [Candidatus Omnitrophota bacterium]
MNIFLFNFTASYLITGVLLFILAFFVYCKNKSNILNKTFACYSFAIAWWSFFSVFMINSPNEYWGTFWDRICLMGVVFIPAAFLDFNFTFLRLREKWKTLIRVCYGLSFFFFVCNLTPYFVKKTEPKYVANYFTVPGTLYYFFLIYFFLSVICGVYLLYKSLKSATPGSRYKHQLLYFFWATILGYLGGSLNYNLVLNIPPYSIVPFGNYLTGVYVVLIAYAILKHRLMDVKVAFTSAGIFTVVYTLVLGFPFWIGYHSKSWLLTGLIMFAFATIGPFIYRALRQKAENILLSQQKHYQKVLLDAAKGMVREHNLERLFKLIVYVVKKAVKIEFVAAFLNDKENKCYRLKAIRGLGNINYDYAIAYDDPAVKLIKHNESFLGYDEMNHVFERFFDKPAHLIVPSYIDKKLVGFLVLGEKINRTFYSPDDINVFEILSRQAALAIDYCLFLDEFKRVQEKIFTAEKLASIGGMADGVAHQIRNRLNSFSIAAGEQKFEIDFFMRDHPKLFSDNEDLKKSYEYLKNLASSIINEVKRTAEIIQGILNYARVEEKETFFSEFSLKDVIDSALSLVKVKHQISQFPLETDITAEDIIYGVKAQIMECMYNIIDNAYEAMDEKRSYYLGEEERLRFLPHIFISLVMNETSFLITIADNGLGIQENDRKKIFAPFFTTKSSQISGTGIGMYVVKRMIEENHQGRVWFESEYMEGTTFYIELPRKKTTDKKINESAPSS